MREGGEERGGEERGGDGERRAGERRGGESEGREREGRAREGERWKEREQGRVGKKEVEEGREGGRAPCGKAICWPGDEATLFLGPT